MPVRWVGGSESRFRVQLTPQGQDAHWLSPTGDAPFDASIARFLRTAAAAQDTRRRTGHRAVRRAVVPIVSYQPYGTGRVVSIEGCGTVAVRAFMPPQFEAHPGNLCTHVAEPTALAGLQRGPPARPERGDRDRPRELSTSDTACATLLLRNKAQGRSPRSSCSPPASGCRPVRRRPPLGEVPGVYRVVFGKLAEGSYEAAVAGTRKISPPAARCSMCHRRPGGPRPAGPARLDGAHRQRERRGSAAERFGRGGGAVVRRASSAQPAPEPREAQDERGDRPWVLVGILLLWTTAWAVRRSSGLT